MNSWIVVPPTAWRPPPITFPRGSGKPGRPAPARYRYSGFPAAAAAALADASEVAVAVLAPIFSKFGVPSISRRSRSRADWSATSRPFNRPAMEDRKIWIALSTPPLGHAGGSWAPVLAPLGAATRPAKVPDRISTSTVGFPRLSRIFRMTAPSIEGIPEPRDAEGPTARRELADRDIEGVRDRFGEEERRRPEGNLQRPGAEDAGSLKTSENHENVSVAPKGRACKKVSSLARGDRSTEVVPYQNQVYQDQTRDERRNRRADAPDDREDHDDDRQPTGPWSKVQETRADRGPAHPAALRSTVSAVLLRRHARWHRLHHAGGHRCRRLPNDAQDASDDSQDQPDDEPASADDAEQREQQDDHAGRHVALRFHPQHHGADQDENCEDEADGPIDE